MKQIVRLIISLMLVMPLVCSSLYAGEQVAMGTDQDGKSVAYGIYTSRGGTGKVPITLVEKEFFMDSYNYHHDMARFSMALSMMCYSSLEKSIALYRRMLFADLGFSAYSSDRGKEDGSVSPFDIAYKKIENQGKEATVIVVAIRGAKDAEWMDSFDAGTGETHKGFQQAADYVYEGILDFIHKNSEELTGDVKILITGHSRGAAVANLLGQQMDQEGIPELSLKAKDVFVYAFATPNYTRNSERTNQKYHNIFNIVNPEDFVSKVLPSAWGYGRYGITYVLPSKTTEGNGKNYVDYEAYLEKVRLRYQQYKPDDVRGYQPYEQGTYPVYDYFKEMTSVVRDISAYYDESLGQSFSSDTENSLQTLFSYTLGNFQGAQMFAALGNMYLAAVGTWGEFGRKTLEYFIIHQAIGVLVPTKTPDFQCAHTQEFYLAAMETVTEEQLKQPRQQLLGTITGSVNLVIRDENQNVVGRITNGEIDEQVQGIVLVDAGNAKEFLLPGDRTYQMELSAPEKETVNYCLCKMDADIGETGRAVFQNLEINRNSPYTQRFNTSDELSKMELKESNGKVKKPDQILGKDEIGTLSIEVDVEGNGSVKNRYHLTPGDTVSITAKADLFQKFLGWYDTENHLISNEKTLEQPVFQNERIKARFTKDTVGLGVIDFGRLKKSLAN
ncbi:MAG: hypothetical protein K6G64_00240 [Eubacterium sp.]|nr:hypothetical protein [Eubacterium sp.]